MINNLVSLKLEAKFRRLPRFQEYLQGVIEYKHNGVKKEFDLFIPWNFDPILIEPSGEEKIQFKTIEIPDFGKFDICYSSIPLPPPSDPDKLMSRIGTLHEVQKNTKDINNLIPIKNFEIRSSDSKFRINITYDIVYTDNLSIHEGELYTESNVNNTPIISFLTENNRNGSKTKEIQGVNLDDDTKYSVLLRNITDRNNHFNVDPFKKKFFSQLIFRFRP